MKQKQAAIKCSACEFCSSYRRFGNTRATFNCDHPDQCYILNYFRQKGTQKMPGFLGYGARNSDTVPVKTSPAWCPKKIPQENIR